MKEKKYNSSFIENFSFLRNMETPILHRNLTPKNPEKSDYKEVEILKTGMSLLEISK